MNTARITLHHAIAEIPAAEWDACAGAAPGQRAPDPFTTHRFLSALEASGSVDATQGWAPHHLCLRDADGQMIAALPLYLKSHSQGEYVFDHGWADAYERAGGQYYPKLQTAVPFTPVPGARLLCRPGMDPAPARATLFAALENLTGQNGLSSAHITFCTEAEAGAAPEGWLHRVGQQFHWQNDGYGSYEDFLAALSSRKRKALRKERARAQGFGGQIVALSGDQIRADHWDAFWLFYQETGARKWGRPYLTRAFFTQLHETMRADLLLVLALNAAGQPIAGALNLIGADALFGRYWGALEPHPFLHFELCYHQAIDWAIAHGLARLEAGAQGEHKLARGYLPHPTHSLHYIAHPGLRHAVAEYLEAERAAMDEDIEILTAFGPFRRNRAAEDSEPDG